MKKLYFFTMLSIMLLAVTGATAQKKTKFKGSSSNLVVISFLFQLSSSFLILLKVVDMFAF